MFFIIQGELIVMQKSTQTFITNLKVQEIFGEISFFSGAPRSVTIKSRGFSELMYLNQVDFLRTIYQKHNHAVRTYEQMRFNLIAEPKNLLPLFIKCYHCHCKGHIAINCDFFNHIKGNLSKKGKKKRDQLNTTEEHHKER